jgi:hypothetical protein
LLTGAGVGIAAVSHDCPRLSILQLAPVKIDTGCPYNIGGEYTGSPTGIFGINQGQIVFIIFFNSGINPLGQEALRAVTEPANTFMIFLLIIIEKCVSLSLCGSALTGLYRGQSCFL